MVDNGVDLGFDPVDCMLDFTAGLVDGRIGEVSALLGGGGFGGFGGFAAVEIAGVFVDLVFWRSCSVSWTRDAVIEDF